MERWKQKIIELEAGSTNEKLLDWLLGMAGGQTGSRDPDRWLWEYNYLLDKLLERLPEGWLDK